MTIYSNSSENNFKPTYLYVKQHQTSGLKYFGKTTSSNPIKYHGSGVYWLRHLKKYGFHVNTVWYKLFTNKRELIEYALKFSSENNIVESDDWANLKIENGLDGGDCGNLGKMSTKKKLQGKIPLHVYKKSILKHTFFHENGMNELCTVTEMTSKYKLTKSGLSHLISGKLKSYLGWRITQEKQMHANTDLTLFTFRHKDGRVETATRNKMIDNHNLSRSNLNAVIRGDRNHVKGWQLLC